MATNYPDITTGLGKLTPAMWRRGMNALEFIESSELLETMDQMRKRRGGNSKPYILAKITGSSLISGESWRWKYAWSEYTLSGDTFAAKSGGLSGTYARSATTYALNTAEAFNSASFASPGVDLTGADYPPGFEPQPITDAIVLMFLIRDSTNKLRYLFNMTNAHDGTCSA